MCARYHEPHDLFLLSCSLLSAAPVRSDKGDPPGLGPQAWSAFEEWLRASSAWPTGTAAAAAAGLAPPGTLPPPLVLMIQSQVSCLDGQLVQEVCQVVEQLCWFYFLPTRHELVCVLGKATVA
jgi:hypothetical protein